MVTLARSQPATKRRESMKITITIDAEPTDTYDSERLWQEIADAVAELIPDSDGDVMPGFTVELAE